MKLLKNHDGNLKSDIEKFIKRELEKDGVFANLIIPATVSFLTTIVTLLWLAKPLP